MTPLLAPLAENPLIPAWAEVIAAVVFALILWFLIARYVVPNFERTYAERTEAIQGGIEKAERAQAEAQAALEQYRAQLSDSRAEAARIREDAKTQGSQILAEMREQAQAEATRIREQTQAQLAAERSQAMNQLRNEIGGLATTLAGRIVGESLDDDERARRTVDRFIADLEAQDAASSDGPGAEGPDGRSGSHAYSGADPA
jgi:F-type H+-transporting ATPase subunit b